MRRFVLSCFLAHLSFLWVKPVNRLALFASSPRRPTKVKPLAERRRRPALTGAFLFLSREFWAFRPLRCLHPSKRVAAPSWTFPEVGGLLASPEASEEGAENSQFCVYPHKTLKSLFSIAGLRFPWAGEAGPSHLDSTRRKARPGAWTFLEKQAACGRACTLLS